MLMRVNQPPFTDVRVRQAFKMLTDRAAFVESVWDGFATAGNDCVGHTFPYFADDLKAVYDPERARSLLKAAGHDGLSVTLLTSPAEPGMNESATLWAAQAKAVGVNAAIKSMPTATYYTSTYPGYCTDARAFSMTYWDIVGSLPTFYIEALIAGAEFNETAWGSPNHDLLINDALAETDPAKAADKWHAVQEVQQSQGGYLVPANYNYVDGYAPSVRGAQSANIGPTSNFTYYKAWVT